MVNIRIGNEADKQYIFRIRPQAVSLFSGDGYFLVAEDADGILGCTVVFSRKIPAPVPESEAFINLIEVFENSNQQKGVASLMVQEVLKMEKEKGAYQVRAYCDIRNVASHRLWLKNGFGISPVKESDRSILGSFVTYVL